MGDRRSLSFLPKVSQSGTDVGARAVAARQETIQTAKDIFRKGKDAAVEQTREAILDKLPEFISPDQNGESAD